MYPGRGGGPLVDSFAIGCLIGEMLNKGKALFCDILDGPTHFRERLAILYRILGPIDEEVGMRIESDFPGTFEDEDYREVALPFTLNLSENTRDFLETACSLNVTSMFVVLDAVGTDIHLVTV